MKCVKKKSNFESLWIDRPTTRLTMVWKHEWRWTRKGGFWAIAKTLFSTITHSMSSSWMMTSFFNTLIAYNSSVPFRSASITWRERQLVQETKSANDSAWLRRALIFISTIFENVKYNQKYEKWYIKHNRFPFPGFSFYTMVKQQYHLRIPNIDSLP